MSQICRAVLFSGSVLVILLIVSSLAQPQLGSNNWKQETRINKSNSPHRLVGSSEVKKSTSKNLTGLVTETRSSLNLPLRGGKLNLLRMRFPMIKRRTSPLYLINGTVCRFVNYQPICTTLSTTGLTLGQSGGSSSAALSGGNGAQRPLAGSTNNGPNTSSGSGSSNVNLGNQRPITTAGLSSGMTSSSVQFANQPPRLDEEGVLQENPTASDQPALGAAAAAAATTTTTSSRGQQLSSQIVPNLARPYSLVVNRPRPFGGLFALRRPQYQLVAAANNRREASVAAVPRVGS